MDGQRKQLGVTLLIAAVIVAPLATAGTMTNPDIIDDSHDAFNHTTGDKNDLGRLDIVSGWISDAGNDQVTFNIKVRDLLAWDDAGAFGDVAGPHWWLWNFEVDDIMFYVSIWEDQEGDSFAEIQAWDIGGGGLPATRQNTLPCEDHPQATLEFDTASDTISFTADREFTFRHESYCPGQPAAGETKVDLGAGLGNNYLRTIACTDGDVVAEPAAALPSCGIGFTIDTSIPDDGFWLEQSGNEHLMVRPISDALTVQEGGSSALTVLTTNPTGITLETDLSLIVPEGWSVTPASRTVSVAPGETVESVFDVTAGTSASAGIAVLKGAGVPTEITLLIGDYVPSAIDVAVPAVGQSAVSDATLYFYGSATVNSDRRAGVHGSLVDDEPFSNAAESVERELDGTTPIGIWSTDSVPGFLYMGDTAMIEAPFAWSGTSGIEFVALLGTDLPLDWDGEEELSGVATLSTSGDTENEGDAVLVFEGSTAGIIVPPGEDLEVAFYATADAGTATLTVYDAADPAKLTLGYTSPVIGAAIDDVLAADETGFTATVASATPLRQNDAATEYDLGLDSASSGDTSSSLVDLVYHALPGMTEDHEQQVSLAAGSTDPILLTVPALGEGMRITVADAAEAPTGNLWVEVTGVRSDGVHAPLAMDRSPGVTKDVLLAPLGASLGDFGQIQVRLLPRPGLEATEVTITAEAVDELRLPGAWTVHRTSLEDISSTSGTGSMTLTGTAGTVADVPVHYTPDGPTIAPTADFVPSAPAVHPGDAVTFIDRSHDPEGALASWAWDLGDGTTSTDASPTHSYSEAGTYVVSLTVTDAFGIASEERLVTMTVVPPGEPLPDFTPPPVGSAIPAMGTAQYYANLYSAGVPHLEDYGANWANAELQGAIGTQYLAAIGDNQPYAFGSITDDRLKPDWTDGLDLENHVGATIATDGSGVFHSIGDLSVSIPAQQGIGAFGPDEGKDGRVLATTTDRTLSILQGTIHSDVRTTARSGTMDSTTILTAPAEAWLAYGSLFGVQVVPVADSNGLTVPAIGANQWFAVFDPAGTEVIGTVLAGGLTDADLQWADGTLTLTGHHAGTGDWGAAQYLSAYSVATDDATRYAGIQELARMDRDEVGIAYLTRTTAAAVPWAGSGATMSVVDAPSVFPDLWIQKELQWGIDIVDAEAGEPVRAIVPAGVVGDEGLIPIGTQDQDDEQDDASDADQGRAESPSSEFQDEATYVGTFDLDGTGSAQPMQLGATGLLMPLIIAWVVLGVVLGALMLSASSMMKRLREEG